MTREGMDLSRRERQIMEVVVRRGEASARQVHAELPDAPSYSAVRALLRILEEKGHLQHREEKGKYIYSPTRGRRALGRSALRGVVETFFEGSAEKAVAALLASGERRLTEDELKRLAGLIERARKEERS